MIIVLPLIAILLVGLFFGIKNQNRVLIRNSIIALVIIGILGIVYSIMYAMNPY